MTDKQDIQKNKTDFIASVAKSVVGFVPFAGTLLSELIGTIIPNQRIDRLTKYVQELDSRILEIQVDNINELINNEEFVDLLEEGFVQASRAISDERRSYIASIITNGITNESIKYSESKYLMKILAELNDIEVIWLRYYMDVSLGGDEEFREKHENVLTPVRSFLGSDKETLNKSSLQDSYIAHLERLQLIRGNIDIDRQTGMPEFENSTGKPKVSYTLSTNLGELLLEQIGLTNEK